MIIKDLLKDFNIQPRLVLFTRLSFLKILIYSVLGGFVPLSHHLLGDGIGKKYSIWPAVELGRHLLLVLFIVAYPGNDVSCITKQDVRLIV